MSIRTESVPAADLRPGDATVSGAQTYVVEHAATHDDDPMVLRGRVRLALRKHADGSLVERHLGSNWHVNCTTSATGGLL